MNVIDVIVLLIIVGSGVYGFKNGFIKQAASLIGLIIIFYLSFVLKDPIAEWLSLNLPFFDFMGSFRGATILNVIIYQLIAFFIVFSILSVIYAIVIKITGVIEKVLKMTIILAIPSKALGLLLGLIEGFVISMILIMVLSLPILNFGLVRESTSRKYLYNNSPIIGNITKEFNSSISDVIELKDQFNNNSDRESFNLSCFDALLKHKIIGVKYSERLVNSGKLGVDENKANAIIAKYK